MSEFEDYKNLFRNELSPEQEKQKAEFERRRQELKSAQEKAQKEEQQRKDREAQQRHEQYVSAIKICRHKLREIIKTVNKEIFSIIDSFDEEIRTMLRAYAEVHNSLDNTYSTISPQGKNSHGEYSITSPALYTESEECILKPLDRLFSTSGYLLTGELIHVRNINSEKDRDVFVKLPLDKRVEEYTKYIEKYYEEYTKYVESEEYTKYMEKHHAEISNGLHPGYSHPLRINNVCWRLTCSYLFSTPNNKPNHVVADIRIKLYINQLNQFQVIGTTSSNSRKEERGFCDCSLESLAFHLAEHKPFFTVCYSGYTPSDNSGYGGWGPASFPSF